MENATVCNGNKDTDDVELYDGDVLPLEDFLWRKINMLESQNVTRPFFLVDQSELFQKLEEWRRLLPRVEPFYALKCNSHPIVTKFFVDAGVGFDCASKTEIEQVLNLGVHPSRIIYANPFKESSYLTYAAQNNVDLMTFDNTHELMKIKKYFPNARLILRIMTKYVPKMFHNFNKKFGCHVKQSRTLLAQAVEMKLNVVGVSFHVGGPVKTADCHNSAIENAYHVFNIGRSLGFNMEILDIGGAFPGTYNGYITFPELAESVNKSLDQYFPASEAVRVIAEPGRFFVTTAFTLAVNIIGKRIICKQTNSDEEEESNAPCTEEESNALCTEEESNALCTEEGHEKDGSTGDYSDEASEKTKDGSLLYMYVINQGTTGTFANVPLDNIDVEPKVLQKADESDVRNPEPKSSIVYGPICAAFDCVVPDCILSEMEVGQWLYFPNMGAYTLSIACGFNGIELPLVFPVCSRYYWNKMNPKKQHTSHP